MIVSSIPTQGNFILCWTFLYKTFTFVSFEKKLVYFTKYVSLLHNIQLKLLNVWWCLFDSLIFAGIGGTQTRNRECSPVCALTIWATLKIYINFCTTSYFIVISFLQSATDSQGEKYKTEPSITELQPLSNPFS